MMRASPFEGGSLHEEAQAAGLFETFVLSLAIATQVIACGFAVIQIFRETPDFVGVFATASAGALAWLQAQAYMTAAKELSRIGSTVTVAAISDAGLSRFVLDSENTISREHTLWLAKRS